MLTSCFFRFPWTSHFGARQLNDDAVHSQFFVELIGCIFIMLSSLQASNLLMVLRSDLTLAFFLAENNFIR